MNSTTRYSVIGAVVCITCGDARAGEIRHYIVGLPPGAYAVRVGGEEVGTFQGDSAGLVFCASVASPVWVRPAGVADVPEPPEAPTPKPQPGGCGAGVEMALVVGLSCAAMVIYRKPALGAVKKTSGACQPRIARVSSILGAEYPEKPRKMPEEKS